MKVYQMDILDPVPAFDPSKPSMYYYEKWKEAEKIYDSCESAVQEIINDCTIVVSN